MTGGSFANGRKAPTQVRCLPSHGNWDSGCYLSGCLHFKKMVLGPWGNTCIVRLVRNLLNHYKDLCTFGKDREKNSEIKRRGKDVSLLP